MTLVKMNQRPAFSRSFNDLFDEFFNQFPVLEKSHFPAVNISESENAYELSLWAPGLTKEDFEIKVEDGNLSIGYEHKTNTQKEDAKSIRSEFSWKSFKRSFHVADVIDTDNITAKYENGVLVLHLPKLPTAVPAVKQIAIQ